MSPGRRLGVSVGVGLLAGLAGLAAGWHWLAPDETAFDRRYPLPHHVPKFAGGLSLRLAMVHDVVHERYPAHGEAFHAERRRTAEERLAKLPPTSPEAFDLLDDLGASLDKLGRPEEAAAVLRDKLARQDAAGVPEAKRYTTFANLGTFLVHAHMKAAMAGDKAAAEKVREGLRFVRKSIEVNPAAHFGREEWQARIIEFLLEVADDPQRLRRTDCIGDSLESLRDGDVEMGQSYKRFGTRAKLFMPVPLDALSDDDRTRVRQQIVTVGNPSVPFDEPVLGILGMWREGGGANPHFALALGEIMLRVGQRFLAWTAFERAAGLGERFHPTPGLQQFLRDHCRKRQGQIEATLPAGEVADLRPRFEAELAFGQRYQREYQEYEAAKLAAGVPPGATDFYAEFDRGRPPIASKVGEEEWYVTSVRTEVWFGQLAAVAASGLFGFGLGAFLTSLLIRKK